MVGLPVELTSFVGRRGELAEVERLLGDKRLLTVVGPGGVGKTRLVSRAVEGVADLFADGVSFVWLDSLCEPDLVVQTVAGALGLRHLPEDPITRVIDFLRDKSYLLVLDNCEHLVDACAELVSVLLCASPGLRIVATSRQALNVEGEHRFKVEPLPIRGLVPTGRDASGDAVALFADRATAVAPRFAIGADNVETIVQICQRLDGVPLSIELAAARLRVLSPQEVLGHLENRFALLSKGSRTKPARHRTLSATVDWSYGLCTEEERALWRQLSVFSGGFTLAAAEAVCDPVTFGTHELLDLIGSLVDKSILQRDADHSVGRCTMLDTIRQYGSAKLSDADRVAVQRRHRDYFVELTGAATAVWCGPRQVEIAAHTQNEHANLRAALSFSLSSPGEHEAGAQLAVNLGYYWLQCGYPGEGRIWLDRILENTTLPNALRIDALRINGWAANILGDSDTGRKMTVKAFAMAQQQEDPQLLANTLVVMGGLKLVEAEYDEADRYYRQCVECYESIDKVDFNLILSYAIRGMILAFSGRLDQAEELAKTALSIADQQGEQWCRSYASHTLALIGWRQGRPAEAVRHAQESLHFKTLFNDMTGQCLDVELCAWVTAGSDPKLAAKLLGIADGMWARAGGEPLLGSPTWINHHVTCKKQLHRTLGEQAFTSAFAEGANLAIDLPRAVRYVLDLDLRRASTNVHARRSGLTQRETKIAELVASGKSNKAIAHELTISHRTVEVHIEHILNKLGFTSRTQIAVWQTEQKHTSG